MITTVRLSQRLHRQLRIRDMILVTSPSDDRIHVGRPGTRRAWCGAAARPRAMWYHSACRDCVMRVIVEFQDNRAGDLRVGDTVLWRGEDHLLTDIAFNFPRVHAFTPTDLFAWDETEPVEIL